MLDYLFSEVFSLPQCFRGSCNNEEEIWSIFPSTFAHVKWKMTFNSVRYLCYCSNKWLIEVIKAQILSYDISCRGNRNIPSTTKRKMMLWKIARLGGSLCQQNKNITEASYIVSLTPSRAKTSIIFGDTLIKTCYILIAFVLGKVVLSNGMRHW